MRILVSIAMKIKAKNKKGFSIGEVLIAMFILLIGIVDAIFLTVRSVGDLKSSRDAVIATLLAQEGTELVRNVRDNNVTQMTCGTGDERCTAFDMDSGYGFPSVTGSAIVWCAVDYETSGTDSRLDCSGSSREEELYLNEQNGLYSHSGGGANYIDPHLRRRIYIKYETSTGGPVAGAEADELIANVTSVVVFGDADFPADDRIEEDCLISKDCVYAQTRLTSWINYGD